MIGDGDLLHFFRRNLYAGLDGAVTNDVVDVCGGKVSPRTIRILYLYLVADV